MLSALKGGMLLRANNHSRHRSNGFNRIAADCRFRRQHDSVGAIQNRIGNVKHLCPGRGWRINHRLHHLGCGNGHLIGRNGAAYELFLNGNQILIPNFNPQISARNHDPIGCSNDF